MKTLNLTLGLWALIPTISLIASGSSSELPTKPLSTELEIMSKPLSLDAGLTTPIKATVALQPICNESEDLNWVASIEQQPPNTLATDVLLASRSAEKTKKKI